MRTLFNALQRGMPAIAIAVALLAGATSAFHHHQPKLGDLPDGLKAGGTVSPGDRALDRQFLMCRGC